MFLLDSYLQYYTYLEDKYMLSNNAKAGRQGQSYSQLMGCCYLCQGQTRKATQIVTIQSMWVHLAKLCLTEEHIFDLWGYCLNVCKYRH